MKCLSAGILLLAGSAVMQPALANDYPKASIRFINASSAGGVSDIFARALTEELGKTIKQPMIIENRPGGSFNIATRACADAEPDGYTFCVLPGEVFIFNPHLFKSLSYNADKDIKPVMTLFFLPQVLAIRADMNVKSIDDLVALSKAKPNTMSYASPGVAQTAFIESFIKREKGGDMVKVPFRGGGDAVNGMMTGTTPLAFIGVGNLMALLESKKAVGLVIDGDKRLQLLPDVPTAAEIGFKDNLSQPFYALFAPANTPDSIIKYMRSEISKVLASPAFVQRNVLQRGLAPAAGTLEEVQGAIAKGRNSAERVVREAGLEPQ